MSPRYLSLASKLLAERFPVEDDFMGRFTCILESGSGERLLLRLKTGDGCVEAILVHRAGREEKSCCCLVRDLSINPQVTALAGVLCMAAKEGLTARFLELQDEAVEGGVQ
jgi:hypothetical protein